MVIALDIFVRAITALAVSIFGIIGNLGNIGDIHVEKPIKEMTVTFENERDYYDYIDDASNLISEGNEEDGYTYSIYKDSFTTIEYTNVHSQKLTFPSHLGGYKVIGVNYIGYSFFVEDVVFPDEIEFITCEFGKFVNLKNVSLPSMLKFITYGAFDRCRQLKELTVPESIDFIPATLCGECYNLKTVKMGSNVKTIEGFAFAWCKSLENIVLPETVKEIQTQAFDDCVSLKTINLPNSLEIIGFAAFLDCKNLKIDSLPDNLKKIDDFAFQNCKNLEELYIPNSVTKIGNRAFSGCNNLTIVTSSDYVIEYAKANNIDYRVV